MHPLLVTARDLSRRIYASLPWGYRVAGLMLHLASNLTDIFGRAVYQEFIRAGVPDMPPINGQTPSRDLKRVPPGYGKKFGDRVYAMILNKSRNPDTAEEVISTLMVNIAAGKIGISEGTSLYTAEGYVVQSAINTLKMVWRKENLHKEKGLTQFDTDDAEAAQLDFADPNSFRHLEKMLPESELNHLMRDLEHVHKRAPSWLEAKLDGLTGVELAQEWGVGKSQVANWEKDYMPDIKRVLTRYLQDAA